MKRLLLFLISSALAASATVFTVNNTSCPSKSCDWNLPATYVGMSGTPTCHTNIPCSSDNTTPNGDTITIADDSYQLFCSAGATCSVGQSPAAANTASITVTTHNATGPYGGLWFKAGSKFVWNGAPTFKAGTIQFDNDVNIYHDSSWRSTPLSYQFFPTTVTATYYTIFLINSIAGHPVIWHGDSFDYAGKNPANCTVAKAAGCQQGSIGITTNTSNDQAIFQTNGAGTGYMIIKGIIGTGNGGIYTTINAANFNMAHLIYTDSARHVIYIAASATGNFICDMCVWTNNTQIASPNNQTLYWNDPPSGTVPTGTYVIRNSLITGRSSTVPNLGFPSGLKIINSEFRSDVGYSPITGGLVSGTAHDLSGLQTAVGDIMADSVLFYGNRWAAGGSGPSTYVQIPANLQNSVLWTEWQNYPGIEGQFANAYVNTGYNSAVASNNVVGFNALAQARENAFGINGLASPLGSSEVFTNFFTTCGSDGNGIVDFNVNQYLNSTVPLTLTQGVYCETTPNIIGGNPHGVLGMEGNTVAGAVASMNSMYIYNPTAAFVTELCGAPAGWPSGYPTPDIKSVTELTNNAVVNTNSNTNTVLCNAPAGANWIVPGGGPANDVILQSGAVPDSKPHLVDPIRSLPLFSEYLIQSGIYPESHYTGNPQYKGAWANGIAYSVGDIVYDDSTVSNSYGGRKTYWICVLAHTSVAGLAAGGNQPIVGIDSTNNYQGHVTYWQEAWLPMWFEPALLAGTTFNDGSIGCTSTHSINTSPSTVTDTTDCGAARLLERWIHRGGQSLHPIMWTAGKGGVEIGFPTPMIHHIPPPLMVN